jgi:hypothetical protein
MSAFLAAASASCDGSECSQDSVEFDASDAESFYDEDIDDFGTLPTGEDVLQVPDDDIPGRPPDVSRHVADSRASDSPYSSDDDADLLPPALPSHNPSNEAPADDEPKPPPGKSIAHFDIEAKRVVYCSFDLETAGEHGGVIQVSAQLFRPNPVDPTGEDFIRVEETFNRYVCPPDGAIWNEQACRLSHGLSSSDECIQNARDFASHQPLVSTHKFWILDRVCHQVFQSAIWCYEKLKIGSEEWSKYLKKNGRYVFQIDLGIAIINYALNKAWPNAEGPPPAWIRQLEFLPCDCGVCFFCDHGLTSGIVHKHKLENARVTVTRHKDNSTTVTTGHTRFRVNL